MQELLQALEIKILVLLQEREAFMHERDMLAAKVMELEESVRTAQAAGKEQASQDIMLASMAVEDLINKIDESCKGY